MKRLKLLVLIYIIPFSSICQSLTDFEYSKYWYYRHRLVTEFMITGETPNICNDPILNTPGVISLPANTTFFYYPNDNYARVRWNDATVDLAFYISVLAMEYKLLKEGGWDTSSTLEELYFAMKAYERLDHWSKKWWYEGKTPNCVDTYNGYFIRDDVDRNAINIFATSDYFNKYKINNQYSYDSDFIDRNGTSPDGGSVTPDQLHALLTGWKLVQFCIADPSIKYNGVFSFVDRAVEYSHKSADYLKGKDWRVIDEFGVRTPSMSKSFREMGDGFNTAKAAGSITPSDTKYYLKSITRLTETAWKGKQALQMKLIYAGQIWSHVGRSKGHDFTVAHMAAGAVVGNSFKYFWGNTKTDPFIGYISELLGLGYYGLLYDFFQSRPAVYGLSLKDDLINAPGYGTQYRPEGTNMNSNHPYFQGENGWRANNRWIRFMYRFGGDLYGTYLDGTPKVIPNHNHYKSNGLDYMALYNIFNINYKNTSHVGNLPSRAPGRNLKITTAKYIDYNIHSYNYAALSSQITTSDRICISASDIITLSPGFRANGPIEFKVTGPINACGDQLNAVGELLNPDIVNCPTNSSARLNIGETNMVESVINTKIYKDLNTYILERNSIDNNEAAKVDLYPNPVDNECFIRFSLLNDQYVNIKIMDLYGKIKVEPNSQFFKSGLSTYELKNINTLPTGFYIINIQSTEFNQSIKIYKR